MMMDVWALLWIIVCFTILISILESIHQRAKERKRMLEEQEIQQQIRAQPYHVYSLQPFGAPMVSNSPGVSYGNAILSVSQQQQILRLQEEKAKEDLPPKYEDVVLNIPSYAHPATGIRPDRV